MKPGHEDRKHMLMYNLPTIKTRLEAAKPGYVLVLLGLNDKAAHAIYKAFLISELLTETEADTQIAAEMQAAGEDAEATGWLLCPEHTAKGFLETVGNSGGKAWAEIKKVQKSGQFIVAVVAFAATLYTAIDPSKVPA